MSAQIPRHDVRRIKWPKSLSIYTTNCTGDSQCNCDIGCTRRGFLVYFITPSLLLGIRLKSAHEIERTGMTNVWNWTNVDDWPRGIEIGCFFGLFTTRIRRFSSPFLKIAFLSSYTSKKRHFSGSFFGRPGRVGSGRFSPNMWKNCLSIWAQNPHKTINLSTFQMVE